MKTEVKRNKLVNFRVSEEEFTQLTKACDASGARCLSAFTRNAVLAPRNESAAVTAVESRLAQMTQKLDALLKMLMYQCGNEERINTMPCPATAAAFPTLLSQADLRLKSATVDLSRTPINS